jgi:hypothetical protein
MGEKIVKTQNVNLKTSSGASLEDLLESCGNGSAAFKMELIDILKKNSIPEDKINEEMLRSAAEQYVLDVFLALGLHSD